LSCVSSELKMNFKKIRRVVKLDDITIREACKNMRNLVLLERWILAYAENVNAGVNEMDLTAQVSPRKEKIAMMLGRRQRETIVLGERSRAMWGRRLMRRRMLKH
jgi:hypothetical protein